MKNWQIHQTSQNAIDVQSSPALEPFEAGQIWLFFDSGPERISRAVSVKHSFQSSLRMKSKASYPIF
jgi:hypothetical protein